MESLKDLLNWSSQSAGVRLLELPRSLEIGFSEVRVEMDGSLYGIDPDYTWEDLKRLPSAAEARNSGLLSEDFQDTYFERSRRIALDRTAHSAKTGTPFYNGKLARLRGVSIRTGRSPGDEVLALQVGYTSYFTGLGTNSHFQGYRYRYETDLPDEPGLPDELVWPALVPASGRPDWRAALSESPLANPLAVHLFLYNDWEILYVRRGMRVGQQPAMWNSPVNGVMEFSDVACDLVDGEPSIHLTASREAKEELGLVLDSSTIRWIGLATNLYRCQPFVIGVARIPQRKKEVARSALEANTEVDRLERAGPRGTLTGRRTAVSAISAEWDIQRIDVSLGPFSLTIPLLKGYTPWLKSVIRDKVLQRQEKIRWSRRRETWTPSGAASLLLCLAHHCGEERIEYVLQDLRREMEGH